MELEVFGKNLINVELAKQNLKKNQLAQMLKDAGVDVSSPTMVMNKINRGNLPLNFFLQCMKALGVKHISLEELYRD